jgi:hypothetical protein
MQQHSRNSVNAKECRVGRTMDTGNPYYRVVKPWVINKQAEKLTPFCGVKTPS